MALNLFFSFKFTLNFFFESDKNLLAMGSDATYSLI